MFLTILIFIAVLAVLILAHEFGHYITAKLSGIEVQEFGLGYPPRIFSFKRGETVYSLNAVPLGGFTKMLGEEDPKFPRSLASKNIPTRILVLSAGSLMNLLLPILLYSISFMVPHTVYNEKVLIEEVNAGSPAQMAGIAVGDQILSINGRKINNRQDVSYQVQLNLGSDIVFLLQKPEGTQKELTVHARWDPPAGEGATGIRIKGTDLTTSSESVPFWEAIPGSFVKCWEILVLFKNEVFGWFTKDAAPVLAGPVGIVQLTGEVAKTGFSSLLEFTALLSINLAIINLFPFPGLDGGRLVFVLLEFVRRGKRISPKKEGMVHLIGFFILIMLILVVTYNDIARIIQGGSLLP